MTVTESEIQLKGAEGNQQTGAVKTQKRSDEENPQTAVDVYQRKYAVVNQQKYAVVNQLKFSFASRELLCQQKDVVDTRSRVNVWEARVLHQQTDDVVR